MSERILPKIIVTKEGPYKVFGVKLTHRTPVETEYGEPVDWVEGPDYEVKGDIYYLCRCGHSKYKPFCDCTHLEIGFYGPDCADSAPSTQRQKVYQGNDLVMTDDISFCMDAGFCASRFTDVWEEIKQTADPEIRQDVILRTWRCPSGRLQVFAPPEMTLIEPDFEPSVSTIPDGPYQVRGGVPIISEESGVEWEVRNRVTLCRCGQSANMPFCDGTHKRIEFKAP